MSLTRLFRLLKEGQERGVYPAAVAAVYARDREYFLAVGYRSLVPHQEPNQEDTLYDLASLTKPLATTLGVMALVAQGRLRLGAKLCYFFPELPETSPWGEVTLREVLSHSAGFPAHRPYFRDLLSLGRDPQKALLEKIWREKPLYPPGKSFLYSDLGFLVLGFLLERINGKSLDQITAEIYQDLEASLPSELLFLPLRRVSLERIAPTERCPWRGRVLRGEVHDENTWALGGVSGAAGLFGTAKGVLRVLKALLLAYHGEEERSFLNRDLVRTFWNYRASSSPWALGFDRPGGRSSAGPFFPRQALGHLGFTGTSFWLAPERGLIGVLLTNRVHPFRGNQKIRTFRPRFYSELWEIFKGRGLWRIS